MSSPERSATLRNAVGLGVAVGLYGAAFGASAVAAGLDPWQAMALSALMFTGASQFALVGVLGAGGGALAAVGSALLLGTRNTVYGVRLVPLLRPHGLRRLGLAHWVIDETTAMALAAPNRALGRLAFLATGASIYLMWNAMTAVGALGAAALGGTSRAALDAVVPAAFLALLWPRLRSGFPEARDPADGGARRSRGGPGTDAVRAGRRTGDRGGGRRRARRTTTGHRAADGRGGDGVSGTVLWATVLTASLGSYLLKLAGLSVPAAWVEQPWVARIVDFVPAALLGALVAVQAATTGQHLVVDGRLVGLAVAALALALRAPFIVVLVLAGAAGALVHVLAELRAVRPPRARRPPGACAPCVRVLRLRGLGSSSRRARRG